MPVLSALADETRWRILEELGERDLSASALANRLPVSRQAIARHLGVLNRAGLVTSTPAGREVRYRPVGDRLSTTAAQLKRIGQQWDRRLRTIKEIAEER
ncbi:MAG TPA: metalloregulator ArsR/SmtB family transcription factor [Acidimicrobiia bacterium]|nr:metalloregulator ArsR/SmtB family transcription factor [Acidimicrobiia bacterium]